MMYRIPVVFRNEWGAKKAKKTFRLKHPIKNICFCWTPGVPPCDNQEDCELTVLALQKKHMSMGLLDIHYNFIVGGDGLIYEGRGWYVRSSKSPESPKTHGKRLDIAYIGDEKVDKFHPPNKQVPPGLALIHFGINYKFIAPVYEVLEDMNPIIHEPSPDDKLEYL